MTVFTIGPTTHQTLTHKSNSMDRSGGSLDSHACASSMGQMTAMGAITTFSNGVSQMEKSSRNVQNSIDQKLL